MVEKMLMGTQAKLDRAKAEKTRLTYKRDLYRGINSSLKKFQNDYFSFASGSKTNMLSSEFFKKVNVSSSSNAVKVTGGSTAGKTTINKIDSLATNLKLQGKTASAEVKGNISFDKLKDITEIDITLDGVTKKLTIDKSKLSSNDPAELVKSLQEQINQQLGGGLTVSNSGNAISFTATGNRTFSISGDVEALGLKSGASNRIDLNKSIKDTSMATNLQGGYFAFSINGKDFSFDENQSINNVISTVNSSGAGVKISYSTLEDKFSIESDVAGDKTSIKIKQTAGNLMSVMFGIDNLKTGTTIATKPLEIQFSNSVSTDITNKEDSILKNLNSLTANGKTHIFEFTVGNDTYTAELTRNADTEWKSLDEVITAINDSKITRQNGNDVSSQNITMGSKVEISKLNNNLTITSKATPTEKIALKQGFEAIDLNINGNTKVKDLGIQAGSMTFTKADGSTEKIEITDTMTVDELNAELKKLEAEIDIKQAPPRFRIYGTNIPIPISIVPASTYKVIFDDEKMKLNPQTDSGEVIIGKPDPSLNQEVTIDNNYLGVTKGTNAKLTINGVDIERNSNNFSIDGINYELNEITDKPITIETTESQSDTFDNIKKFMDDYNNLIDKMWTEVKSKQTYKEYPPLTDAQKKEMTDREIELWEEKAKEGLLRADPTLQAITNAMRDVLNYKPEGSKYSLADLGITTSYDFSKGYGGKLVFSDSTGRKLQDKLANEIDEVEKLFIAKDGIGNKMNEVINAATTMAKPNSKYYNLSLVSISGTEGVPDTNSKLYNQMKDIDNNIKKIEKNYKMEYDRYWKQFTSMEKMIQQMNAQSGWLAQQFGGM